MGDITKRDAVLAEYRYTRTVSAGGMEVGVPDHDLWAVADRIVELEATVQRQNRILAALREPNAKAIDAAATAYFLRWQAYDLRWTAVIRAAVAAAEQEVDRG